MSNDNFPSNQATIGLFDIRQYINLINRHKWVVIGLSLLFALLGFIISAFVLPPKYEASALLGVTNPSVEVNLESTINELYPLDDFRQLTEATKGLPNLAESDDVLLTVCEEMDLVCLGDGNDLPDVEAELVGTNQLKLVVISDEPSVSADFANHWSAEIIKRWERMYGNADIDLDELQSELDIAYNDWYKAQKTLEAYLPESEINYLDIQLTQARNSLLSYLDEIKWNELIIQDAKSYSDRLGFQDQTRNLLIGDSLSLIGILQRMSGGLSGTQLQLADSNLYGEGFSVSNGRDLSNEVVITLENENNQLRTKVSELESEIIDLSVLLEQEQARIQVLEQERDKLWSSYQSQQLFYEEVRIAKLNNYQVANTLSNAVEPDEEESVTLIITALSLITGLILSLFGFLIYDWWNVPDNHLGKPNK